MRQWLVTVSDRPQILLQIAQAFGGEGDDLTSDSNVVAFDKFYSRILRKATIDSTLATIEEAGNVPSAFLMAIFSFSVQIILSLLYPYSTDLLPGFLFWIFPISVSPLLLLFAYVFINRAVSYANMAQLVRGPHTFQWLQSQRKLNLFGVLFMCGLLVFTYVAPIYNTATL